MVCFSSLYPTWTGIGFENLGCEFGSGGAGSCRAQTVVIVVVFVWLRHDANGSPLQRTPSAISQQQWQQLPLHSHLLRALVSLRIGTYLNESNTLTFASHFLLIVEQQKFCRGRDPSGKALTYRYCTVQAPPVQLCLFTSAKMRIIIIFLLSLLTV